MKEVIYPEIGSVTYKKNARSKRITIRIKTDLSVIVTIPNYTTYIEGERVLKNNLDWVKTQQAKLQNSPIQNHNLSYNTTYQIRKKQLSILPSSLPDIRLKILTDKIELLVPSSLNIDDKNIQSTLKKGILGALRFEAKKYLPLRTLELAKSKGISIKDIRIKNVKTKWGSCSSTNNINLSLYLMLLSDDLIDYIIFHELAHVKHKNHSASFWNHLEELLPGALILDKQMKHQRVPFFS